MPSRAGLIGSRLAHLGGYVVGVAISDRLFRPREAPASFFESLVSVSREEVRAVRWELWRANDERVAAVTRRLVAGERSIGRPRVLRRPRALSPTRSQK
jgi:hypothetical protein